MEGGCVHQTEKEKAVQGCAQGYAKLYISRKFKREKAVQGYTRLCK
jgi:hypothetical protein